MNSLDIIKNELINQKTLLEEKGFPVNVKNINPSPSEITETISGINMDFSSATATPEDVKAGKTFYAKTNELKTGTFDLSLIDELNNTLKAFICRKGPAEINIPTDADCTVIRDYAFSKYNYADVLFYKHNLTIPPNITEIRTRGFYDTNITGTLTIPAECKEIGSSAFHYSNISELYVYGGITANSSYSFGYCDQLTKAYIGEGITKFAVYTFASCTAMEEIEFPSTLTAVSSTSLYGCKGLKIVKFKSEIPPTIYSGSFVDSPTACFLVPYLYYNAYYTATNYQLHNNPIYGYGDFKQNDSLPASDADGLYTITWHATLDDAKNSVNPLTICPADSTMYAVFTPIAS